MKVGRLVVQARQVHRTEGVPLSGGLSCNFLGKDVSVGGGTHSGEEHTHIGAGQAPQ